MNREQAEMLLARLVFDELDEPTKRELLAYLEQDAELNERLGDMRLTARLLHEGFAAEQPPKLEDKRRAKILRKLDGTKPQRGPWSINTRSIIRIAACVGLVGLIVIPLLLPSLGAARRSARQMQSNSQLRGIQQSMVMYAQGNDGQYPDDLTRLLEQNYFTPEYMLSPQDSANEPSDFDKMTHEQKQQWVREQGSYVPLALGDKVTLEGKKIVGFEKFSQDKQGVSVVFDDNHARFYTTDEARKLIEQQTGKTPEQLTDNYRRTGNPMVEQSHPRVAGRVSNSQLAFSQLPTEAASVGGMAGGASRGFGVAQKPASASEQEERIKEQQRSFGDLRIYSGMPQAANTWYGAAGEFSNGEAVKPGDQHQATLTKQQKQAQINELLVEARDLQKNLRYEESSDKLNQALWLDPDNKAALAMKGINEDAQTMVAGREVRRDRNLYRARLGTDDSEANTDADSSELIRYPEDWPQLTELQVPAEAVKPTSITSKPKDEPRRVPPPPPAVPVNPWVMTEKDRLSTFAIDVDTASYAIAGEYIRNGKLPPAGTVRMEEFVNAFDYNYPTLHDASQTFAVLAEAAPAPFARDAVLLKIGVRGKVLGRDQLKPAHYVFVIDASGSMDAPDRLPLVQRSLDLLLDQLADSDRVSIVTYNTQPSLVAEAVPASQRDQLRKTIDAIQCQGSTNLLDAITLGYQTAVKHNLPGVNRVILCSDGVANVGPSDADQLLEHVAAYHDHGIGFTSVGFGAGSYDDQLLEQLSNRGDGSYLFIGSDADAKRAFVEDLAATLPVIARNVKIQVEFDPARVRRYRLIGYENRAIADTDFRNNAVDAGEIGSGQCATALYELELLGPALDADDRPDLGTVYVRYQEPDTDRVHEISSRLPSSIVQRRTPQNDPRFFLAASAGEFAELLRGSEHAADGNFGALRSVMEQVSAALPLDQRARQLYELVCRAEGLPRAAAE